MLKAAKPDALVVAHTLHPSFGDVCDMVRLDDVLEHDTAGRAVDVVDQLRFRAAVAGAALPGHLVDTDQWPMPSVAPPRSRRSPSCSGAGSNGSNGGSVQRPGAGADRVTRADSPGIAVVHVHLGGAL